MPSRRELLAAAGATGIGALAGCAGRRPEALRFRNFTPEQRPLTVRVRGPSGEQTVAETVELAANFAGEQPDQPTRDGAFPTAGIYEMTASLPDGPTATDEWRVAPPPGTYHVSVYEGPEIASGALGRG